MVLRLKGLVSGVWNLEVGLVVVVITLIGKGRGSLGLRDDTLVLVLIK